MKTEVRFYQNIYQQKSGAFVMYQSVHDSIESAKKAATNQKKSDKYIGTIELKPIKLI